MRSIKVKIDQSLADVAIQEYGDIGGLIYLVQDNANLLGITDNIYPGDELFIRNEIINRPMVDYLRPFDIATVKSCRGEGIGYWAIERDFIVQPDTTVESTLFLSTAATTKLGIQIGLTAGKYYIDFGDGTGEHEYENDDVVDYTYSSAYAGEVRIRPATDDIKDILSIKIDNATSKWNFDIIAFRHLVNLTTLHLSGTGCDGLTGIITNISQVTTDLQIRCKANLTGDIALLKVGRTSLGAAASLWLEGENLQLIYSTSVWKSIPGNGGASTYFILRLANGYLTAAQLDQLLVDLSLVDFDYVGAQEDIYVEDNNGAPTVIGIGAIAILNSKSITVHYHYTIDFQWQLRFRGAEVVLAIEVEAPMIRTFINGVGTDVGTVTVSTDNITFVPIVYPFTPVVGNYWFKRSSTAGDGELIMNAL